MRYMVSFVNVGQKVKHFFQNFFSLSFFLEIFLKKDIDLFDLYKTFALIKGGEWG